MPLVLLSGFPSSGITTRANELKAALEKKKGGSIIKNIMIIDDESLDVSKDQYIERDSEKAARGAQMAAVQRYISPDTVVILDNMCYIKGLRYQLFCEAKAVQTTNCLIHVGTPADICAKWNEGRSNSWTPELLNALIFRYEEPNSMNRWDSPLFLVTPEDSLPVDEIWDALVLNKPLKANAATVLKPAASGSFLSLLNDTTTNLTKQILDLHKDVPGALITLSGHHLQLPYRLTLPQMNRIKRNFIQLNKSADISPDNIEAFYLDFVQKNLDIES